MVVTILYHDVDGSDTAASGAGPATALTGTAAVPSGQVVSLDGSPDLSGVAVDDVLYFESTDSSTNRRLFRITAVDDGADTVTVVGTLVGSSVNWAIGGERQTFQNQARDDWADWEAGWVVELNDGGTFTNDAFMDFLGGSRTTGPTTIRTAAGFSTKATITVGTNNIRLIHLDAVAGTGEFFLYEDLILRTDSGGASSFTVWRSDFNLHSVFRRVEFFAQIDCLQFQGSQQAQFLLCEFRSDTARGMYFTGGSGHRPEFLFCRFVDIPEEAIDLSGDGQSAHCVACIFDSCGGSTFPAIALDSAGNDRDTKLVNCTFYNSGTHGVDFQGATVDAGVHPYIVNCIFVNNGGYGIRAEDTSADNITSWMIETNFFYNNTSGQVNNVTQHDPVTLTGDPFTNAAAGDFSLNNTAGAGADVRAAALGLTS